MREHCLRTVAPNHLHKPSTQLPGVFQLAVGKSQPHHLADAKRLRRGLLLATPNPRHVLSGYVVITTPGGTVCTYNKSHLAPGADPTSQRAARM